MRAEGETLGMVERRVQGRGWGWHVVVVVGWVFIVQVLGYGREGRLDGRVEDEGEDRVGRKMSALVNGSAEGRAGVRTW